jgi:cell division protein FtsW
MSSGRTTSRRAKPRQSESAGRRGKSGRNSPLSRRRSSASRPRRAEPAAARKRRKDESSLGLDGGVLLAAALLAGIGVVMSYSATAPLALDQRLPPLFLDHLGALALGVCLGSICLFVPLRLLRVLALPAWAVAVALLVLTDWMGVSVNGAQRWLAIPGLGFRFQPVEIAKVATLVAVAVVVARREGRTELSTRRAVGAAAIAAVPVALLLRQPDLGNAVLIGGLAALLLVAAGTPLRRLLVPAIASAAAIGVYIATHAYALRRVTGFLDPWKEARGSGFQLVQSFVAFGKGGITGVGVGGGRQKLAYLPEGHTDFILALVAEELGLIGVLVVLGSFAALWVAGTRIARNARDRFALLLGLAMTALLALPAWINGAVVMGLLPTKGLTLPFLSHGGTSLVMCCGVLGLLLAVGRQNGGAFKPSPATAVRGRRR